MDIGRQRAKIINPHPSAAAPVVGSIAIVYLVIWILFELYSLKSLSNLEMVYPFRIGIV